MIRAIAELINEANLSEIEIEKDDFRVRVTRSFPAVPGQVFAPPPQAVQPLAPAPVPSVVEAAPETSPGQDLASNPATLTSPMVGTSYLSAEPGTPPFVSEGAVVSEGQTILIVEAMKTMNQIPAHCSGKVTRILVEDGQPVEYGEPLVVIE